MPRARLLVCEKTVEWATALRRAAPELVVHETRSLTECREAIAAAPASLAAVETSLQNLEAVLAWLVDLESFPLARAVVLGRRELAPYEWLLREAGALHVAMARRLVGPVAGLARRRLAAYPPEPKSFTEEILQQLPWGPTPTGSA